MQRRHGFWNSTIWLPVHRFRNPATVFLSRRAWRCRSPLAGDHAALAAASIARKRAPRTGRLPAVAMVSETWQSCTWACAQQRLTLANNRIEQVRLAIDKVPANLRK